MTLRSYLEKAVFFFPAISINGHCVGHAYTGMEALLSSNLSLVDERVDRINFGIPLDYIGPGKQRRLKIDHLKSLVTAFDIQDEVNNILAIPKKPEFTIAAPDTTNRPNLEAKLIQLFEALGYGIASKYITHSEQPDFRLDAKELRDQIDLAWAIREAYLKKSFTEIKEELVKTVGQEKAAAQHEVIRAKALKKLAILDELHPYLLQLINLEIYFSNVALYQSPEHFKFLFEKDKHPREQKIGLFVPLLAPTILDDQNKQPGIKKLKDFTRKFKLDKLQNFFDLLADEIKFHCSTKDTENTSALPFALTLSACDHCITVGYNLKTSNWIIIDANKNNSQEISQEKMGEQVLFALYAFQDVRIETINAHAHLLYNYAGDNWILKESDIRSKSEEHNQDDLYDAIKAIVRAPQIQSFEEFKRTFSMDINTKVYVKKECRLNLEAMINHWQNSQAFEVFNQVRPGKRNIGQNSWGLLIKACYYGDIETVNKLIENKANLDKISDNHSALTAAIACDQLDIVKLLLEKNANPNLTSANGNTPLLIAVEKNQAEIIQLLIAAGAQVNANLIDNTSALLLKAFELNHGAAAKMLLKHGAKTGNIENDAIENSALYEKAKTPKMIAILKDFWDANKKEAAQTAMDIEDAVTNGPKLNNETLKAGLFSHQNKAEIKDKHCNKKFKM